MCFCDSNKFNILFGLPESKSKHTAFDFSQKVAENVLQLDDVDTFTNVCDRIWDLCLTAYLANSTSQIGVNVRKLSNTLKHEAILMLYADCLCEFSRSKPINLREAVKFSGDSKYESNDEPIQLYKNINKIINSRLIRNEQTGSYAMHDVNIYGFQVSELELFLNTRINLMKKQQQITLSGGDFKLFILLLKNYNNLPLANTKNNRTFKEWVNMLESLVLLNSNLKSDSSSIINEQKSEICLYYYRIDRLLKITEYAWLFESFDRIFVPKSRSISDRIAECEANNIRASAVSFGISRWMGVDCILESSFDTSDLVKWQFAGNSVFRWVAPRFILAISAYYNKGTYQGNRYPFIVSQRLCWLIEQLSDYISHCDEIIDRTLKIEDTMKEIVSFFDKGNTYVEMKHYFIINELMKSSQPQLFCNANACEKCSKCSGTKLEQASPSTVDADVKYCQDCKIVKVSDNSDVESEYLRINEILSHYCNYYNEVNCAISTVLELNNKDTDDYLSFIEPWRAHANDKDRYVAGKLYFNQKPRLRETFFNCFD